MCGDTFFFGEIAFTRTGVEEGYDYELRLDMLSDNIRPNNIYKDTNRTDNNIIKPKRSHIVFTLSPDTAII